MVRRKNSVDDSKSDDHLLLRPQTRSRVRNLDTQNLGPLQDRCALEAADVVCDLGSEAFVVHQEKVNFPHVADKELLQAVREKVPRLLVAAVPNLGHRELPLEPPPDTVINTLRLPPCLLHALVTIGLVALERLCALLDDSDAGHGGLTSSVSASGIRTILEPGRRRDGVVHEETARDSRTKIQVHPEVAEAIHRRPFQNIGSKYQHSTRRKLGCQISITGDSYSPF